MNAMRSRARSRRSVATRLNSSMRTRCGAKAIRYTFHANMTAHEPLTPLRIGILVRLMQRQPRQRQRQRRLIPHLFEREA
ncbi:MAG: hypothetical protein QOJ04_3096 [Caballeronia sp.]|jgi:hypothetical protein|nr:hypothetical protein [Caballeronia sp.]